MLKTRYPDWRQLPYRKIWVEDTEYYPGAGLANGGREGDLPTPLSSSAIELRTNRLIRWWHGEPYPAELQRLGPDDLYVSYLLTAEYSQRRAHGLAAGRARLSLALVASRPFGAPAAWAEEYHRRVRRAQSARAEGVGR